jgi:hypothetical protein
MSQTQTQTQTSRLSQQAPEQGDAGRTAIEQE